jgi:mannose-6-phosphate isomerase-like protein (cupin superfamily)
MNEAFIVLPGVGRRLDLGNFEALVLATAAQTSSEYTPLQVQGEPPDFGPPLHLHRDTAEAFYVLEGEYLIYVQDRQQLCPPGTFVYVPRDTPHTFRVVSAIPGKKLVLFSPAAMLGYFVELAAAEAERTGNVGAVRRHCHQEQCRGTRAHPGHLSLTSGPVNETDRGPSLCRRCRRRSLLVDASDSLRRHCF